MSLRYLLPAIMIALALVVGSLPSAAEGPLSSDRIGHRRVERTLRLSDGWSASCDFDVCGSVEVFKIPVRTPPSTDEVDVTMTVTFDYETGPEAMDSGRASAEFARRRRGRHFRMGPSWPLGPAPSPTTATLVWQKHGLESHSRRYFFTMAVASREGGVDNNQNFVRGRRLTVVIEMWPAGR